MRINYAGFWRLGWSPALHHHCYWLYVTTLDSWDGVLGCAVGHTTVPLGAVLNNCTVNWTYTLPAAEHHHSTQVPTTLDLATTHTSAVANQVKKSLTVNWPALKPAHGYYCLQAKQPILKQVDLLQSQSTSFEVDQVVKVHTCNLCRCITPLPLGARVMWWFPW